MELNVNGHSHSPLFCGSLERGAYRPLYRAIKIFELQALFLEHDLLEVFINGHGICTWKGRNRRIYIGRVVLREVIGNKS
jgi:hypothetical protein